MNTEKLDYNLPGRLIAQHGLTDRTASRLMVMDRKQDTIEHRRFNDIADYIQPGDCMVLNDSRVIPARFNIKRGTGGKIEGLFLKTDDNNRWCVLLKNASRLRPGETVTLTDPLQDNRKDAPQLKIIEKLGNGKWLIEPIGKDNYLEILERYGTTPLPPYIKRLSYDEKTEAADRQRYQTVYADQPGSVAAPTAGLHFDDKLLTRLWEKSVKFAKVSLHVGLGTFKPITAKKLQDHQMHAEEYFLDQTNTDIINRTIDNGHRIIAVGTTSVRTLETVAADNHVRPGSGWTDIFIMPGYKFKVTDALLTNFHLPKSTLLALVCALAGTARTLKAYEQAVKQKYRFYSYGDAMLIL